MSLKKATQPPRLVESVNALSDGAFFAKYGPDSEQLHRDISSRLQSYEPQIIIMLADAKSIRGPLLDECLRLVEATSGDDYRNSEIKWSAAKKRREMILPDMKYIVLTEQNMSMSHGSTTVALLQGFISFMVTYEDGMEVIYVYEIHVEPAWRRKGVGQILMRVTEDMGRKIGLSKVMLTVFKSNQKALGLYRRLGYHEDEFSPQPRQLRNGTMKESSYVIFSKALTDHLAVK